MNTRYYRSNTNLFLTPDTIIPDPTNPQSLNRYAYVLNNPIGYKDPTGHSRCGVAGAYCDDAVSLRPSVSARRVVSIWKNNGAINDLQRTEPLRVSSISDDGEKTSIYIMPVGSQQSSVSEDSIFYKGGRILGGLGVVIDVTEAMLAIVPGAGLVPSGVDVFVTYFSGLGTGDNYINGVVAPPAGLPQDMNSVNQDFLVNAAEAVAPPVIGFMVGAPVAAESPPAGAVAGLATMQVVDIATSIASALYDAGRMDGYIQNHVTIGVSKSEGSVIVYWP